MLTPADVRHDTADDQASQIANLEKDFDSALRRGEAAGWPAVVTKHASQISRSLLEAVAQRYRDAGWAVEVDSGGDGLGGDLIRVRIHHPGPTDPT